MITELDFYVKKSNVPGGGMGVFSKIDIPPWTRIGSYQGKLITEKEQEQLIKTDAWRYLFDIKEPGRYVAIYGKNIFTKLNYAPERNQNVEFLLTKNKYVIAIQSTEVIKKGHELFIDYGETYDYSFLTPKVKRFFKTFSQT